MISLTFTTTLQVIPIFNNEEAEFQGHLIDFPRILELLGDWTRIQIQVCVCPGSHKPHMPPRNDLGNTKGLAAAAETVSRQKWVIGR